MESIAFTPKQVADIQARISKTDSCWNWTGAKLSRGYGQFSIRNGKTRTRYMAHRLVYILEKGCVPNDLYIDHVCHNLACVNPDHLRPVTPKQNMENRKGARRDSKTGIRGVMLEKRTGKYRGQVSHHGVIHKSQRFDTVEEAEAAVIDMRMRLFTHNTLDRI